jgi:hypothetical protein
MVAGDTARDVTVTEAVPMLDPAVPVTTQVSAVDVAVKIPVEEIDPVQLPSTVQVTEVDAEN